MVLGHRIKAGGGERAFVLVHGFTGCRADFEIGAGGSRNQNRRNNNGYGRGGWRPWD